MSTISHVIKFYLRSRQSRLLQVRNPLTPRRSLDALTRLMPLLAPLPAGARPTQARIGRVPVDIVYNRRADARPGHVLLYVHGGGFTCGSPASHRAYAARLAQVGGFAEVWLPDYRLAPEHPFPAGLDDVVVVWQELTRRYKPERICLAGESAGSNLALGLCLRAREQGLPQPQRLFLLSPWLDVTLRGDPGHVPINDAFFGSDEPKARNWIRLVFARHYHAGHEAAHPLISPVYANLAGLPPIYAHAGECEVFQVDSKRLLQTARAAGIHYELETWKDMFHAFAIVSPWMPEANASLRKAGNWLREGRVSHSSRYQHTITHFKA